MKRKYKKPELGNMVLCYMFSHIYHRIYDTRQYYAVFLLSELQRIRSDSTRKAEIRLHKRKRNHIGLYVNNLVRIAPAYHQNKKVNYGIDELYENTLPWIPDQRAVTRLSASIPAGIEFPRSADVEPMQQKGGYKRKGQELDAAKALSRPYLAYGQSRNL